MPRFVILWHELPAPDDRASHYDLMIETGEKLATWTMLASPESAASQLANRLPDHRLAYLDYEGPISGNRGSVTRWDRGTCDILEWDDQKVAVQLHGEQMRGRMTLRCESDKPEWGTWIASWQPIRSS